MRTISITGVLLFCLLCLGCGAEDDFEKIRQNREQYIRNWSIAQENLKQTPQDSDQTQQDPNESQQEWEQPPLEDTTTQPEIDSIPNIDISTVELPIESKIQIKGIYGCEEALPYEITIHQKGNVVIITHEDKYKYGRKEFSLHIKRFKVFWKIFSLFDIMSFNESYGRMGSTADFRGDLTIDIVTADGSLNKKIHIPGTTIENEEFLNLLYVIIWLVDEDMDVLDYLKPWEK
jgi:hypothetical protein